MKLLRQIPSIGPIRSALLVALLQTPHRFRTKRQLWAYSGFAVETHDSGEYRCVRGKLQRNRERITVRGLNGASDPGTQDCHDHLNHMEERSEFRPPTFASASSLSISGEEGFPSLGFSPVVVGRVLEMLGSRVSISQ